MSSNENQQDIELICPITLQLFNNPVKANDGYIYEKDAITRWISLHGTSPFTRQTLQINDLVPDDNLKDLANEKRNSLISNDANQQIFTISKIEGNCNRIYPTNGINPKRENRSIKKYHRQIICLIIICILITTSIIIGIVFAIKNSQNKIISNYSSSLTLNSSKFNRSTSFNPGQYFYYYENIQIHIPTDGFYQFNSLSSIDMLGYFYKDLFDYTNIDTNCLTYDDDSGLNSQFSFGINLQSNKNYILVVTTFHKNTTGLYSIQVNGPSTITFN